MPATLARRGNTDIAYYLENNQSIGQHFRDSIALGKQPAFEALARVWNVCNTPNWDGYNALPVQYETIRNVYLFINALTVEDDSPSVGAEPDGHVTLEWYRHPRWILSVSVSPESVLHYASLFGISKNKGSEPFFGDIPESIYSLIQKAQLHD